jgi:hypothetical protein
LLLAPAELGSSHPLAHLANVSAKSAIDPVLKTGT